MSRPLEIIKEKKKREGKGRAVTVRAIIGLGASREICILYVSIIGVSG